MRKKRNFAFIVELFILFVILLFVVIVITKTFVTSRNQSLYARHLTESVYIAEEVAEISMASADMQQAANVLESLEQSSDVTVADGQIEMQMDFDSEDSKRDVYRVLLTWDEDAALNGAYTAGQIQVFFEEEEEPIYTLDTGSYHSEGGR
jgi:hypothetical protein